MTVKTIQLEKPSTTDYSRFLRLRSIKYKEVDDRYYQVGNIRGEQGWILHVSATKALVPDLLNRLIPELSKEKVAFKFIQNESFADKTVSGAYGYTWLGKIIRIYPENTERAVQLAKRLIELTAGVIGPVVPTDSWLGGTVYTRYGAHNPVVMTSANGQHENYIHDSAGQLIKDPNEVPFVLTKSIAWPFGEIAPPQPSLNTKTLFNRYMVRTELRAKPKGRVLKTYRVKGLSIKSAVVKEAKHGMCDEIGRSLAERLHWQEKLHRELVDTIRIPKIFELFEERGNTYLSMEYVKGKSLVETIGTIYENGPWRMLDSAGRQKVLEYLRAIVSMVEIFHQHGYVHRDITPENFLIDTSDRPVMIDLELAYDLKSHYPSPPYRLGTIGYMSPEQLSTETPTVKEDIYAMGALMIVFFTNMSPAKFNIADAEDLKTKLLFLFDHEPTVELITRCLSADALLRPTMGDIHRTIEHLRSEITTKKGSNAWTPGEVSSETIQELIERALSTFSTTVMATEGNPWHSNQLELSVILGNKKTDFSYYPGYHTGIAGVLSTIAQSSLVGVKINTQVLNAYNRNLRHLQRTFLPLIAGAQPGLYYGTAGVGVALATGMESGLIKATQDTKVTLIQCLQQPGTGLTLAQGAAGQGLAILRSLPLLGNERAHQLLTPHIASILEDQQPDGAWLCEGEKNTSLSNGISGILLFLNEYVRLTSEPKVSSAIERGLDYLKKQARKSHGKVFWTTSNKNTDANLGFAEGFIGIALTLLRSYDTTKDKDLLALAEASLKNYPPWPISNDFTLATGISGLGEAYLEAYRITNNIEWHTRASWLVSVLYNASFDKADGTTHWIINPNQHTTADLFTGNSGIVQFLLRFNDPNRTSLFL